MLLASLMPTKTAQQRGHLDVSFELFLRVRMRRQYPPGTTPFTNDVYFAEGGASSKGGNAICRAEREVYGGKHTVPVLQGRSTKSKDPMRGGT